MGVSIEKGGGRCRRRLGLISFGVFTKAAPQAVEVKPASNWLTDRSIASVMSE